MDARNHVDESYDVYESIMTKVYHIGRYQSILTISYHIGIETMCNMRGILILGLLNQVRYVAY